MYQRLTKCRACGSTDLAKVFDFKKGMALANDFVAPGGQHQGFTPVEVLFCRQCTLAQLSVMVDPKILYSNYAYVTSTSETMMRHFDRLTKDIISENGTGILLEVGSNDGAYLEFAAAHGFGPVVGIDPAQNLWRSNPWTRQIIQVIGFFCPELAGSLERPDTILARHCFCHQEWAPFMEACSRITKSNTLICIEVPYVLDMLRRTEFDQCYQEHTSYLTLKSVVALLKNYPFHLHGVLKYGVHGGAVMLMLRHNDSGIKPHLSADEMLAEENVTEENWLDFAAESRDKIDHLRDMVMELRGADKIVAFFGASAKSSVIINACGFTNKEIAFVSDNSPLKPGKLVPGTDIPIIEEGQILSEHPDVMICGAHNYRTEVLLKMEKYRSRGGKMVFPMADGWETV